LSSEHIERFLSHLAVDRDVAASTQNQAKSALLFLYKEVLQIDLPWLGGVTTSSRPEAFAAGTDAIGSGTGLDMFTS
jgi:hypothetical protein